MLRSSGVSFGSSTGSVSAAQIASRSAGTTASESVVAEKVVMAASLQPVPRLGVVSGEQPRDLVEVVDQVHAVAPSPGPRRAAAAAATPGSSSVQ